MLGRITDNNFIDGAPEFMETISRYASRGVLVDDMLHIAMMYMSKIKLYKLPGGGIDEDEEIRDAFLREIKEETYQVAKLLISRQRNDLSQRYFHIKMIHMRKFIQQRMKKYQNRKMNDRMFFDSSLVQYMIWEEHLRKEGLH